MPTVIRLSTAAFVAFLAIVSASTAQAQTRTPTAQEVTLIRDCFEKKGGTTEDEACIGLVATPCTETPEGQANLNQANCFRIEAAIWDTILNEAFNGLKSDLDRGQERKLRAMQRAWIAARDRTCEFFYVKIQGSMAVPMSASCMLRETARRALLLRRFARL